MTLHEWTVASALIERDGQLLLVRNVRQGGREDWSTPGGVIDHDDPSILDGLAREVHEETGLAVSVGPPALVNEFHDPDTGFHQIDLYFRCTITGGTLSPDWQDPEGVVTDRRFFSRAELESGQHRFKPDSLPTAAWGTDAALYDPLEVIVK